MNIHATATTGTPPISPAEWEARVDLAAVWGGYRLVAHHGWDDVIYNHASAADNPATTPDIFPPSSAAETPVSIDFVVRCRQVS